MKLETGRKVIKRKFINDQQKKNGLCATFHVIIFALPMKTLRDRKMPKRYFLENREGYSKIRVFL